MLKTNMKKARENIRAYIADHVDFSNYDIETPETWPELAAAILKTFREEKYYSLEYMQRARISEQTVFVEWAAGLPSVLDTCYFYNRSAVDDLGAILEESESKKAKHSEHDAEICLTHLIYRELLEGERKCKKSTI